MSPAPGLALGLAVALAAAVLFGLGAVAQAHAVRRGDLTSGGIAQFLRRAARDPWTVGVVVAYLVGFVLHAVSIWLLPLYLAQATVSLSLPVTALSSHFLREHLSGPDWLAIAAVTGGLVLVSLGSGPPGAASPGVGFAAALWAAALVLLLAVSRHGVMHGAGLGTLAGSGYACSAIAVRGVSDAWSWPVVAAALAVPVFGLLAFWAYSLGLERAAVSSATAPMIVVQTVLPAVVGVALLDDTVRAGWWPGVVLGLVLATGGAVLLSRDLRSPDVPGMPS